MILAPGIRTPSSRATQAHPTRSGGRFSVAQFEMLDWVHEVSGTKWQILVRSMQPHRHDAGVAVRTLAVFRRGKRTPLEG